MFGLDTACTTSKPPRGAGAGQGGNGFITRNTRNGDKNGAKNDKITEL